MSDIFGNIEFYSLLGTLWDYSGTYRNRIKTGKSISIHNPTVSLLGGNTPTGFSLAFPTAILGQGFFSRMILIYGEPNGRRITFPKAPDPRVTAFIIEQLARIKSLYGPVGLSSTAEHLLDKIYKSYQGVGDVRFESYSTRRFTHLLKLCLIVTAARFDCTISESNVIGANTILSHAEQFMPKALGEFGKAKHSEVSHKIIQLLDSQAQVWKFTDIWKHVSNDLERMQDLSVLRQKLVAGDKLQMVHAGQ